VLSFFWTRVFVQPFDQLLFLLQKLCRDCCHQIDFQVSIATASQSRASGDGHNCVPNKDGANFLLVWESDHTLAVICAQPRDCAGLDGISMEQSCLGRIALYRRAVPSIAVTDSLRSRQPCPRGDQPLLLDKQRMALQESETIPEANM
jgi:hypothetical protein